MTHTFSFEISDIDKLAFDYCAVDPDTWVEGAAINRIHIARQEILKKVQDHCNENEIALAVGADAQIQQAFDLGVVIRLEDKPAPILPE